MKLLHLSDLHIGRRVNDYPMLEDQRYALQGIIDQIVEHDIDALLVAGDLYDKATPSAEAVALVDWFLCAAVKTGVRVLCVAGNHDSAERVAYARGLLAHQGVYFSPVYDGTIEHVVLEDEHGPVTFWLIPFLKPATVRPHFEDEEIPTYTDALRVAIGSCDIDPSQRNVALSHQFVTTCGSTTERSDSELVLGGMDNVDASVYDAFDYVALGHIHRPQRVGREVVRYSGSLLKYSLSEIDRDKSAPLVTLGPKGDVSYELIPIKPLHDMRRVRGPLAELVRAQAESHEGTFDYIEAVLEDEHPVIDALERLRGVFPNLMCHRYASAERRKAQESLGRIELNHKSPMELFEEFYEQQNGCQLSEGQRKTVLEVLEECGVQ